jgi:MFS family permease
LLDLAFPPFGIPPVVGFGALSLAGTIVVVITAQVTRRHIKGVDERVVTKMLVALQVMRIAGRATFALAPVVGIALIGSFAERIVTASFSPLFNAWLIRRTNEDVRATVLSTTSMASALGQVGGGPVSGAIGNLMGIPTALLSSAALLVPATVFFARATARKTDEGKAPVPIEAPVVEKFG